MKEKIIKTLRWIGAVILPLPILILTYYIASVIVSFQNPHRIMSTSHICFPDDFIIPGVAGFLSGAASVGISRLLAPRFDNVLGWTVAAVVTAFEIFNLSCLALDWSDHSVLEICTIITSNITCIIGAISMAAYKTNKY